MNLSSSHASSSHAHRILLPPHHIHLPTLLSLLNQALGPDGLIIPRLGASPITQVQWTHLGPVLTLRLQDADGATHMSARPVTSREWMSLIQLTGVLSHTLTWRETSAERPCARVCVQPVS